MNGIAFTIEGASFINSPLGRVDNADADITEQIVNAYEARLGVNTYHEALYDLVDALRSNNIWDNVHAIYPMLGDTLTKKSLNLVDSDADLLFRANVLINDDGDGIKGSSPVSETLEYNEYSLSFDTRCFFAFIYGSSSSSGERGITSVCAGSSSTYRPMSILKGNTHIKDWTGANSLYSDRGLAPSLLVLNMLTSTFNTKHYVGGSVLDTCDYSATGGQTNIKVTNVFGGVISGGTTSNLNIDSGVDIKMYALGTVAADKAAALDNALEAFCVAVKGMSAT